MYINIERYLNKPDGSQVIKKVYLSCPVKCYFFPKIMHGWLKCVIKKRRSRVFASCFHAIQVFFLHKTNKQNQTKSTGDSLLAIWCALRVTWVECFFQICRRRPCSGTYAHVCHQANSSGSCTLEPCEYTASTNCCSVDCRLDTCSCRTRCYAGSGESCGIQNNGSC